jgi:hypothetical protein
MAEEIQASGGAANGFKKKETKAMEEEEKAEEQAPVESAEESGGNQTQPLNQMETSNVSQQAHVDFVEIIAPPDPPDGVESNVGLTLAMEDDDADEDSLHIIEDGLEAGMNEAPGASIIKRKLGESLRQVSFRENCYRGHDSLKDSSFNNHSRSSLESNSERDQMGESMTSVESDRVEQLKTASGSSAPDEHEIPRPQSAKTMVINKQRVSMVVDIESGLEGTRAQTALVRVWTFACGCWNVRSGFLNSCFVVYVMYRFEMRSSVNLLVWELVDVEESNASYPKAN